MTAYTWSLLHCDSFNLHWVHHHSSQSEHQRPLGRPTVLDSPVLRQRLYNMHCQHCSSNECCQETSPRLWNEIGFESLGFSLELGQDNDELIWGLPSGSSGILSAWWDKKKNKKTTLSECQVRLSKGALDGGFKMPHTFHYLSSISKWQKSNAGCRRGLPPTPV